MVFEENRRDRCSVAVRLAVGSYLYASARLLRRIGESLRLPDYKLDSFKENIRIFLERR